MTNLTHNDLNQGIFTQTFGTWKSCQQQKQAIKTIPVTIVNAGSKSKEILGKLDILNLHKT